MEKILSESNLFGLISVTGHW